MKTLQIQHTVNKRHLDSCQAIQNRDLVAPICKKKGILPSENIVKILLYDEKKNV